MPWLLPRLLHLKETERTELNQLVNRHTTPQQIALRAKIILFADAGLTHRQIARQLQISRDMARQWRDRWLDTAEKEIPVVQRLQDAPRPGAPATFTAEQLTHLFAIACEEPAQSARPISHWTASELALEWVFRGIVENISPRHVRRLLKEADLKPHQTRPPVLAPLVINTEQARKQDFPNA
ncbi:helix-turn-helix domain-containing protein [Candidatus Poribacteria bacterium]|nr:helix-turn-helix domain-containing protein [Candidatus Poribacteria bacterium]